MPKVNVTVIKKPLKRIGVGGTVALSTRDAKLLVLLGRAQYQTAAPQHYQHRMLTAATSAVPAPTIALEEPAQAPATDVPVAPVAPAAAAEVAQATGLDSAGAAWDESVHSSTRAKNSDGTWRKRPGAKAGA